MLYPAGLFLQDSFMDGYQFFQLYTLVICGIVLSKLAKILMVVFFETGKEKKMMMEYVNELLLCCCCLIH